MEKDEKYIAKNRMSDLSMLGGLGNRASCVMRKAKW